MKNETRVYILHKQTKDYVPQNKKRECNDFETKLLSLQVYDKMVKLGKFVV